MRPLTFSLLVQLSLLVIQTRAIQPPGPSLPAPALSFKHDLPLLEQNLARLHTTHQRSSSSALRTMDTKPNTYTQLRSQMASFFTALPTAQPRDLPLHLSNIQELRSAGYRFPASVDPGLHLPFGTPWDFTKHGPYPSTRLAQGAFPYGGNRDKVRVELDNAWEALDRQTMQEAEMGKYARLKSWTDNVDLLRGAIDYHGGRIEVSELAKEVGAGMRKVLKAA